MAQETQYCNFKYILGTAYSGKTDASEISPYDRAGTLVWGYTGLLPNWATKGDGIRIAADSTILRIVNLFIALSFGVHLEQLEQFDVATTFLIATAARTRSAFPIQNIRYKALYFDARFLTMVAIYALSASMVEPSEALVTAAEDSGSPDEMMYERWANGRSPSSIAHRAKVQWDR